MDPKKWYLSKTLWVNVLAVFVLVLQGQFGWIISPETQVVLLGAVNFLLRLITKTNVTW